MRMRRRTPLVTLVLLMFIAAFAHAGPIFNVTSATFGSLSGPLTNTAVSTAPLPLFGDVTGFKAWGTTVLTAGAQGPQTLSMIIYGDAAPGSSPFTSDTIPVSWRFSVVPSDDGPTAWVLFSYGFFMRAEGSGQDISGTASALVMKGMNLGPWILALGVAWSASAPGQTLALQIPENSIDVNAAPIAIPEPTSALLSGCGLLAIIAARRRKSWKCLGQAA